MQAGFGASRSGGQEPEKLVPVDRRDLLVGDGRLIPELLELPGAKFQVISVGEVHRAGRAGLRRTGFLASFCGHGGDLLHSGRPGVVAELFDRAADLACGLVPRRG